MIEQENDKSIGVDRISRFNSPLREHRTHQFMDKKMIGVFRFSLNHTIIAYSDGFIQKDETTDPRKVTHLQLPFNRGHAINVILTIMNEGEDPVLIF